MTRRGNCGGVSNLEWDRFQWTCSNYCAWVEAGATREERASRLEQVPASWREAVEAHVRCCFLVRGEARYRREVAAKQKGRNA